MKNVVVIFLIWLAVSCSPSLYKPSVSDPELQADLLKGRSLYVSTCSNCHNLHLPKEYSANLWVVHLNNMQTRAKISLEEKALILKYITYPQ